MFILTALAELYSTANHWANLPPDASGLLVKHQPPLIWILLYLIPLGEKTQIAIVPAIEINSVACVSPLLVFYK